MALVITNLVESEDTLAISLREMNRKRLYKNWYEEMENYESPRKS